MSFRVLELFCGIGGFGTATAGRAEISAALDQSLAALSVYRLNHPTVQAVCLNLESASPADLQLFSADMWWMSPPCQPYTVRGKQRDIQDPRGSSFLKILALLPDFCPSHLAMENVPGFQFSQARQRLLEILTFHGYRVHERLLCPTELGIPNRRPRYYLVATRDKLLDPPSPRFHSCRLSDFLDAHPSAELGLDASAAASFSRGFRKIDPGDPQAYATCFTSGYGKSLMHSGSYLHWQGGLRRFSPEEILRLLGFPRGYRWPDDMPLRKRWHLAGNSLSLCALREVLRVIPPFE